MLTPSKDFEVDRERENIKFSVVYQHSIADDCLVWLFDDWMKCLFVWGRNKKKENRFNKL